MLILRQINVTHRIIDPTVSMSVNLKLYHSTMHDLGIIVAR